MKQILTAFLIMSIFASCDNKKNEQTDDNATAATATTKDSTETKPVEFADARYADVGKHFIDAFSKGDIDGWMTDWADNGVFVWNSGDSVAGKTAIGNYWKDRWTSLDSITFTNAIWLPITVNKPQSVEAPGTWLLGWYMFNEKFKNGKRVVQWAHDDLHFNDAGKVDRMIHYVDMAPIKAALGK